MNFRVGQKVVCVDNQTQNLVGDDAPTLTKGAIYTVTSLDRGGNIRVAETKPRLGYEWFWKWRFRAAVEPKTDISIFTRMLTPVKQTERA